MPRLGARLLGAALALLLLDPSPADAQARVNVYVMQYASSDGNDGRHGYVAQTIQDRLNLLRASIYGRTRRADYLRQMQVIRRPAESAGSDAALLQSWRSRGALALMWGRVNVPDQLVTSSIYIGDLARPPQDRIEMASISLRAENDPRFRDTHSLIAGFALLQDARRNRAPPETVAAILATLNNIATNLQRRGYLNNPDLRQIKDAIDRIGQEFRGR